MSADQAATAAACASRRSPRKSFKTASKRFFVRLIPREFSRYCALNMHRTNATEKVEDGGLVHCARMRQSTYCDIQWTCHSRLLCKLESRLAPQSPTRSRFYISHLKSLECLIHSLEARFASQTTRWAQKQDEPHAATSIVGTA